MLARARVFSLRMSAETAAEVQETPAAAPVAAPATIAEQRTLLEARISQLEIELDEARKELAMLAPSVANPETP